MIKVRKLRFAAGVTLYNPSDDIIYELKKLSKSFEKVYLFDNSDEFMVCNRYQFDESFEILSEGENKGLPYAFNKIIEICSDYDFLCTLDQDSIFSHDDIVALKKHIDENENIDSIGVVAPIIDYGYNECDVLNITKSVEWVITSGSFVNLNIVRKEGVVYDENYFIDRMEVDMCKQLKSLGYEIIVYCGAVLHHSLGENLGFRHSNHSVLRNYYMFRNRFYYNKKWFRGWKRYLLNFSQALRHIYLIVLYEKDKKQKIKMLRLAYNDYRDGIMGKKE